jgi:hypothetical protein
VTIDPVELVCAIAHEVRNHLTAVRLQADTLPHDAAPDELASASDRFHILAELSGALLGQLRALLIGSERGICDPADAIDSLRRNLPESFDARVRYELKSAVQTPPVAIESRTLYCLLMTGLIGAFEAAPEDSIVSVSALREGPGVVFSVAAPVRPEIELASASGALAGRRVELACADAILRALGGSAECRFAAGRRALRLAVPVAA